MKLLTVKQVAEILEVSVSTVKRFIHTGQLATTNVGVNLEVKHAQKRINEADLREFIAQRRDPKFAPVTRRRRRRKK